MSYIQNAIAAHINQYSALNVEDSPAIDISLSSNRDGLLGVEIADFGGGLPSSVPLSKCFEYFFTTVDEVQPTYTYSGSFGLPFQVLN